MLNYFSDDRATSQEEVRANAQFKPVFGARILWDALVAPEWVRGEMEGETACAATAPCVRRSPLM